ncbi:unnamed protein product [Dicrocoelium dendriticum]|nr:unnamed protein product [Dicrocoelium dendriticum]
MTAKDINLGETSQQEESKAEPSNSNSTLEDGSTTDEVSQICEALDSYYAASFNRDIKLSSTPVSLSDVQRSILTIKLSIQPGPDGIPPAVIKYGGKSIPLVILNVFTLTLNRG